MATNLLLDPTSPTQATVTGITQPARPVAVDYASRADYRAALDAWRAARAAAGGTTGGTTGGIAPTPTPTAGAPVPPIVYPAPPASTGIGPITVPPISYTPTPVTAGPVEAPVVPAAPTADQAMTGIAPLSSVDTSEDLPALRDDNVESIITRLLSGDSDLMKQARTSGLKLANARGVINSSIGIGAAENEAVKAATPLALQEAALAAASNTQRYDLSAQMDRLRAQAGFERIARAEGYSYQSSLNQSSYAYQAQQQKNQNQFQQDMAKIAQGYAVDMAGLQYTLQAKLQTQANDEQMQRMAFDFTNQWKLQQQGAINTLAAIKAQGDVQLTLQANQFQEAMKELTLTLNSQNSIALANASVNLFSAEAEIRAGLLSNPNIPAAERAAYEQQISALTQPTRDYVSKVLGYVPTNSTTPPTTGGTTGGASTPPASGGGTSTPRLSAGGGGGDGGSSGYVGGGGTGYSGGGSSPAASSGSYGGIAPVGVNTGIAPSLPGGITAPNVTIDSGGAFGGMSGDWKKLLGLYGYEDV